MLLYEVRELWFFMEFLFLYCALMGVGGKSLALAQIH